jgi:hypothetical protein
MDFVSYGADAVNVAGAVMENAMHFLTIMAAVMCRSWEISRAIFNPLYFGFIFLAGFTYAWFRMEQIAESKRLEANSRILLKKSSDKRIPLVQYTDTINGKLFAINNFMDIIKSMFSKGKTPLKMAPICQPVVRPSEANVLWESSYVRVKTVPVQDKERLHLFEYIRKTSTLSIRDATQIVAHGGLGYWASKKGFFHKERTVFLAFNFHDSVNFFAIYADANKLKRLCSVSTEQFFESSKVDTQNDSISFEKIENIRFHDSIFFNAVCLLLCHSERRSRTISLNANHTT